MGRLVLGSQIACCLVLFACGGTNPDGTGYVLLDLEARASGLSVQVGGRTLTSVLPVEVGAHEHAMLVGPGKGEALDVGNGELVYVRGPGAAVSRYAIGRNVADDALRIDGDEDALETFARHVGGRMERHGEEAHLVVPGAYVAAATALAQGGLVGVAPVVLDATGSAEPPPDSDPGVDAKKCEGVAGTWRSLVYSEPHQAYYDFTLVVRQPSADAKEIAGTIEAHSWATPFGANAVPTTCSGDEHWTVVEDASGTVSADGAMDFRAQSWRVGSTPCGPAPRGYWLDNFRVARAVGASTAAGVISDDHVWVDGLDLALTRVGCP